MRGGFLNWNLGLVIGNIGVFIAIACVIWFMSRLVLRQPVSWLWMPSSMLLMLVSVVVAVGSQIEQLSFGT